MMSFRKNYILALAICMISVILVCVAVARILISETVIIECPGHQSTVGEILADTVIRQPIAVSNATIESIALMIGTYRRINSGLLNIQIADSSENMVREISMEMDKLVDNTWCSFDIDPALPAGTYSMRISADNVTPGNSVTLYRSIGSDVDHQTFDQNGRSVSGSLTLRVGGQRDMMDQVQMLVSKADLTNMRGSRILAFALFCLGVAVLITLGILGCLPEQL